METRNSRGWSVFLWPTLAALCVFGWHVCGVSEVSLSGSFGGRIESTASQLLELDRLSFGLTLRGEDWHTSMRAIVSDGDLTDLGFSDHRQLGPLSLASTLAFDPSQCAFTYLSNLVRFRLFDVGFANYAYLSAESDRAYDQITIDGAVGGARWRSVVRASLCPLELRTLTFQLDWPWNECRLDLSALASFACDTGFERFRLSATRREVPCLSFGSMVTDFVVTIEYKLEEKSIVPQLRTRAARTLFCLSPMLALDLGASAFTIDGLEVYGVKLECSVGEAVDFYAATSLAEAKNVELIGHADYFEVYRLTVRRPSCCGPDTRIETAFYFTETSTWLFNLGMVEASVQFPLGGKILWMLATEYAVGADWVMRIGWEWMF